MTQRVVFYIAMQCNAASKVILHEHVVPDITEDIFTSQILLYFCQVLLYFPFHRWSIGACSYKLDSLFRLTASKTLKLCISVPLWGESTGHQWIPPHKGSAMWEVFPWHFTHLYLTGTTTAWLKWQLPSMNALQSVYLITSLNQNCP